MNLNDLSSRVDTNTNAGVNRAVAQANPEFDAGMGDDGFDDFGDIDSGGAFGGDNTSFGGASDPFADMGGDAFGGGDPFAGTGGDAFGGGASGGGFGFNNSFGGAGFGQPQQPAAPQQSPEDKAFEVASNAAKGSMNFFKTVASEAKGSTPTMRASWGRYSLIMGIIFSAVGILLAILYGAKSWVGIQMLVGGLIASGISVMILTFAQSEVAAQSQNPPPSAPAPSLDNSSSDADFGFDNDEDFSADDFGFDDVPADDDVDFDDDFGDNNNSSDNNSNDNGMDDLFSDASVAPSYAPEPEPEPTPQVSGIEAATAALDNIQGNGLFDRRSLFERQLMVLSNITKEYATQHVIPEGSDQFNTLDALVQNSAEPLKTGNTNETPYLISAVDTLFYIRLEISRPKFIKNVEAYTQEIVNIAQYDTKTGKRDKGVYGIGEFVGNKIYVKLMKGESAFVSLKDIYDTDSDKILDYKNKMPVVLGVDIEGSPVICDFFNYESILITGMPRSGKTWLMLSVLYQMMAYMSPDEVNFYICDPKGRMSDFANAITPHVKSFVADNAGILAQLKYVVRVEGQRRKNILGADSSDNSVNLAEYKKKHPDCKIPYIYVIIDEVVTLASCMSDEDLREFQALLSELVSQLPAAGIRIFMVPHLVKDNIIKKNTTSLIPCRISVMGNKEHIESSCGVKNFPHTLNHIGDTCTFLKGFPEAMFIHSAVLAEDNEGNKQLFKYLADMWARICPDSVAGSVYERVLEGRGVVDAAPAEPADSLGYETAGTTSSPITTPVQNTPSNNAAVNKRGVKRSKPIPANTTPVEVSAESGSVDDDWHNDIRMNGKALNLTDEVNLFDDDF